MQIVVKRV